MTVFSSSWPPKIPIVWKFFFCVRKEGRKTGVRNGRAKPDLTSVNVNSRQTAPKTLVLLSGNPENSGFGQVGNASARRKKRTFLPVFPCFQVRTDHSDPWKWSFWPLKVIILTPESDHFDHRKWSFWGRKRLRKFENLPRKCWKMSGKWRFSSQNRRKNSVVFPWNLLSA